MAFRNTAFYSHFGNGSSTGYYAVVVRPQNTAVAAGVIRRQFTTPAIGAELCFACIIAGTTANTTDATWVLTRGGKTVDGTATWIEVTGQPGVNGDIVNCPVWAASKTWAQGEVIYHAGTLSIQVCTTAGAGGTGAAPGFSATAGVTTNDASAVWTSLGLASTFGTWAAPFARVVALDGNHQNVLDNSVGGNTVFVADNSAETTTTNPGFNLPSITANPTNILSIDHTLTLPVAGVKAGASMQTLNGTALSITQAACYWYGMTFIAGSGANSASLSASINTLLSTFDHCTFQTGGSAGGSTINFGSPSKIDTRLIAPSFQFGAVSDQILVNEARVFWSGGGSILGAVFPTNLITGTEKGTLQIRGFDFSALTAGKKIVNPDNAQGCMYDLIDCKLGAGVTLSSNPTSANGGIVRFTRCDSGGTNYKQSKYDFYGTQSVETTIVRTGGATDGTTPQSWNLTTTANSLWVAPLISDPIRIWNDVTGSAKTLTIYGIWGGGAVPNNDDIWIEVAYLGDAGDPLGLFINSTKASLLAANAACTADGSTWGGSTTKFKMAVTFTPQLKGFVTVQIKAAKLSSTFYIDPLPVIT